MIIPAGNLLPNQDCDSNGVPDECDPDTDGDGMIDECDLCPTMSNEIDDCANALPIGEGAFAFCNEDATLDGPVDCGGASMSRDIWFQYVAPTTGLVTIDTCAEQDFDTILAVYTGDCGALTLEGCSDDDCELSQSSRIANLPLAASEEILIRVGAYAPDLGVGILTVDFCLDDDTDGVCNEDDICPGFDDNVDTDGDGVPDGCDICPGYDDNLDDDGDGVPDGCDLCPDDPNATITNLATGVTYLTLQDAVSAGFNGEAIQLGAGFVCEDNITFPNGVDLTIRGAGAGLTIIDGGGAESPDYPILAMYYTGQTSATMISDLTLRNGTYSTISTGGGALVIGGGASPEFRRVEFLDNSGNGSGGGAHVTLNGTSTAPVFDRCVFTGAFDAWSAIEGHESQATFLQCLFADNAGTDRALEYTSGGWGTVVNCTIVHDVAVSVRPGTTVDITNSVLTGAIQYLGGGGVVNTSRCLYTGATGDNIDGTPTFVDAPGGDYRLAPGSLGIDAADYDEYTFAGGGATDLSAVDRLFDDSCTDDTGSGTFTYLDVGAYELQDYPRRMFGDLVPNFCPLDCPQPNIDDILCVLNDFSDGPTVNGCGTNDPPESTDLAPCGGDGVIDVDDILAVLDAFGQVFACPHPCP